ncbi:restriction endonuclease subunit S [Bacillus sp. FJAT-27251]|uniref:restriction endonuclease subunit S n=1 Tax=Bacillus sp. FJAT-27251 TaxID=1684142 RepID=UPI0006A75D1A|nr:restriction endonuclease subunit S [Bacillus sp. FJAT-27251]
MNEWNEVLLKDISFYSEDRIGLNEINLSNYISTENMKPNREGVTAASSLPAGKTVSAYFCDDILISNIRPYFKKIWFADKDGGCSNDVLVIRSKDNEQVDSKYLYYNLFTDHFFGYVMSGAKGAKMPRGDREEIMKYSLSLPPLNIQKKIASILSNIDNKIQINLEINKTLEQMAMNIYKHWFIDFERFNESEYKDSEFGLIPKELNVKRVDDLGNVVTGKTPSTKNNNFYNGKIPFIKIPDMHNNTFIVKTETTLSDEGASTQKNKMLPPLTVCVSCIATPGLVVLTTDFSQTNQQINSIVCNEEISPYFAYLSMVYNSDTIISLGSGGTATLNLNKGDFSSIKLLVPNNETMNCFHKQVESLFEKIKLNAITNQKLMEVRDYILPLLLRGDISIVEAAEIVREVISNEQPEPSVRI